MRNHLAPRQWPVTLALAGTTVPGLGAATLPTSAVPAARMPAPSASFDGGGGFTGPQGTFNSSCRFLAQ